MAAVAGPYLSRRGARMACLLCLRGLWRAAQTPEQKRWGVRDLSGLACVALDLWRLLQAFRGEGRWGVGRGVR
jgi:hypothetical protein